MKTSNEPQDRHHRRGLRRRRRGQGAQPARRRRQRLRAGDPDPGGRRRHRAAPVDHGPVPPVGHLRRDRAGELAERLLRDPHAPTGDPIAKEPWPELDAYGQTHDPPHPPRRLHRRPARRAARGHGAARPQAGDHRGPAATTRPSDLRQRRDGRGRPRDRRRRHPVDGAPAAVQRQGAGVRRRARLPRGHFRRRRPRHGDRRQPADVHRPGHEGLPAAAAPPRRSCRSTSPP